MESVRIKKVVFFKDQHDKVKDVQMFLCKESEEPPDDETIKRGYEQQRKRKKIWKMIDKVVAMIYWFFFDKIVWPILKYKERKKEEFKNKN